MKNLKALWEETEKFLEQEENKIVEKYITFLREVAEVYLKEGRRVFFHENKVIHYAEGGFGTLLIEAEGNNSDIGYISEIRFEQKLDEKEVRRGYIEIKEADIARIKYELH